MKKIEAVQIWKNGEQLEATLLNAIIVNDNLETACTFYYQPLTGGDGTEAMRITINGNVMIGASSDSGDRLRVTGGNGNTFTDTITTLRPDTESKSVAWRLGVVSGGTTTPDRLIRVMVDGIEYNIPAREA